MVTIGIRDRDAVFSAFPLATACIDQLRLTATEHDVAVLAYCFMPDHVHLVLRLDGSVNLIDFIRLIKGRSSRRAVDHGARRNFWQESFYDHLIRPDEDADKYVRYVLENPVRAKLVERIDEYQLVGTFEYDVDTLEDLVW